MSVFAAIHAEQLQITVINFKSDVYSIRCDFNSFKNINTCAKLDSSYFFDLSLTELRSRSLNI